MEVASVGVSMTTRLLPLLLLLAPLTPPTGSQKVQELSVEGGAGNEPVAGSNITLSCKGRGNVLQWRHGHHNIIPEDERWHVETETDPGIKSRLTMLHISLHETGHYSCIITKKNSEKVAQRNITIHVQASPVLREARNATVQAGHKAVLSCTFTASPPPEVHWIKGKNFLDKIKRFTMETRQESQLHWSELMIENVTIKDNGTYECVASNDLGTGDRSGTPSLLVQDVPEVNLTRVRAIGTSQIQVEWDVADNNAPIITTKIFTGSSEDDLGEPDLLFSDQQDIILENVGEAGQDVWVKILVANEVGPTESDPQVVTLLSEEPAFVPEASPKGSGLDSFTVGWTQPEETAREFVGRYHLSLLDPVTGDTQELFVPASATDHLFTDLKPATEYSFMVAACKDLFPERTRDCGEYSESVVGRTLNGVPGSIEDLLVDCHQNPHTAANTIHIRWQAPAKPNGKIDKYKIEVKASASYVNQEGQRQYYNNEQKLNVLESLRNYTYHDALPNTNYTVKVSAGIVRQFSSAMSAVCRCPVWLPYPARVSWWKYTHEGQVVLRLPVPRVSQRNGTICCHRIVVVKLGEESNVQSLGDPGKLPLSTYEEVHRSPSSAGAYVAEAFSGWHIKDKYLLLGDGEVVGNWSGSCAMCLGEMNLLADAPASPHTGGEGPPRTLVTRGTRRALLSLQVAPPVVDGILSSEANYTGFIMMSVQPSTGQVLTTYSEYFPVVQPVEEVLYDTGPTPSISELHIIYVAAGLFTFLLLLTIALCTILCFYKRRNKHLEEEEVAESLSGSLGRIFRSLRRSHTLMSQPAVDVKPVPREELVPQYIDKLRDSELGFRREYEVLQALPEKFYDRTSRASDMIENAPKNRYPDIKAYDQTRIKLTQINGAIGSDYINANFVLGYKERKKFICAQGPMDTTVDDFWRMIVEQGCGVVVMLTNLEETGKIKCVKYWPEAEQPKTFGNVTIYLVKEKAFSDFMVRTLRIEWGEADDLHTHEVRQYHYLLWKDFVAPEHPTGVLSFLRRINEAYTQDQGPLLIHCSAGVGRTGTLVALDSLVMELDEEGHASIFNFICDLRHQRNFLVQSLKQYVFIHRALMEYTQFGNTELSITQLKEAYSNHTHHDSLDDSSPLEKEFERLGKVVEDRKAFAIATSEENKPKNRYDFILPYDSNRVILAPLSTRPSSTYINASFVTGYDLAESFIVTQDPMENTVADFWRMVFDQEVTTIVMLSELGSGEGCCNKYWPDDEETFEHISVKLVSSENYPKYSLRTFLLTNTKNSDAVTVTHFHYIGWSGMVGEVPLVTQGIMEIITRVQSHTDASLASAAPTLVHCSGGGDRTSVYCCLNNCLRQLRREGRVDIFQTARRIRALRQFQLQEFAQFEFSYKALVEFIDNKGLENV